MARYPAVQKRETHQRILDAAGRLFRTEGYAATGVAKVMSAAGLTVGGFYAHFASKEALLAEVLTESLAATRNVLLAGIEDLEDDAFVRELMRRYLSRAHRDLPADGCALPSLTGEVSRQSEETRQVFQDYLERLIAPFADRVSKDKAIALICLAVGGVMFARAVKDKELSDRILMACRRFAAGEEKV
jgi:TetR/AcrR family transcriptional regulator, transcriptional repressor for nem operon